MAKKCNAHLPGEPEFLVMKMKGYPHGEGLEVKHQRLAGVSPPASEVREHAFNNSGIGLNCFAPDMLAP
jgi:hypothetical protein